MRRTNPASCVKSGRKAFTLIELLVVIAIIALLVSILMPSLYKAKDLAKGAVCLSNVHHVGDSLALYLEDNKQNMPAALCYDKYGNWLSYGNVLVNCKYLAMDNAVRCPKVPYNKASTLLPLQQMYGMRNDCACYDWPIPFAKGMYYDLFGQNHLQPMGSLCDWWVLVDSYDNAPGEGPSQFYCMDRNSYYHQIHMRHNRQASTLFADFSVRIKDAKYFTAIKDSQGGLPFAASILYPPAGG